MKWDWLESKRTEKILIAILIYLMVCLFCAMCSVPLNNNNLKSTLTPTTTSTFVAIEEKYEPVPTYDPFPGWPAGANAKCNDGTFWFNPEHRGSCSGHGGVKDKVFRH